MSLNAIVFSLSLDTFKLHILILASFLQLLNYSGSASPKTGKRRKGDANSLSCDTESLNSNLPTIHQLLFRLAALLYIALRPFGKDQSVSYVIKKVSF